MKPTFPYEKIKFCVNNQDSRNACVPRIFFQKLIYRISRCLSIGIIKNGLPRNKGAFALLDIRQPFSKKLFSILPTPAHRQAGSSCSAKSINPRSTPWFPPHRALSPAGERGKVGELNADSISDIKTFQTRITFSSNYIAR
jgi:hypothetical protein